MVNEESSAPSFQHVRSPIRFYRVHSASIRFGDSEERWRACSLGHSTEVEVGSLHLAGPAGEAGVAVAAPAAAGYWVVDFAEGPTFGETLKALDKTGGSNDSNTPNANGFVSTQTCANYVFLLLPRSVIHEFQGNISAQKTYFLSPAPRGPPVE